MRIGVCGTGQVGQTIASRLVADGHRVAMGSRDAANDAATAWAAEAGTLGSHGTFADAADGAELVVNCTSGIGSLAALASIDPGDLAGTVLLDVANPLDFSEGFPPTLATCNTTSLGEQIQRAHPEARVVKALNTMHCTVMVDPARVPGTHHVFVCGNDADAKASVTQLLAGWGWTPDTILDLGDITNARGTEMVLPLWVRLVGVVGTSDFNLAVVR